LSTPLEARAIGVLFKGLMGAPVTADVSTAGKLVGGSGVTDTIGTWTAVSDGRFKVAIDGSAATEVGPIDFSSGVTTMANVASKIQAAIRAIATGGFTLATVAWDATDKKFTITSGTAGNASAVSLLTAPTTGTNIGVTGFMKCTTGTLTPGKTLYQHVFKLGTQPYMFFQQGFLDLGEYWIYNGVKVGKMSLSLGGDGELVADFDLMGMKGVSSTVTVSESPTVFSDDRFGNFQASLMEGGSALTNATELQFSIDRALDGDTRCIGGQGYRTAIEGSVSPISGSVKTLFENKIMLEKAKNGTESSIAATITNGSYVLEIICNELEYEPADPIINDEKGILIDLPFQAYFDNHADSSAVVVKLTNDVASYA
jgi:hypothetical protein